MSNDTHVLVYVGNVLTTKHRPGVHIEKKVAYISNTIYSTLAIYSAHMADAGTYVCRTSGLLTTSFKVDVLNGKY
ncbi:hypothetical protein DPMN_110907 [Dreissena polymorpha]|uniref:Uncharacterized protein n=1 Tax=Dreissena polymorpha TaxID=45954 RepID=A0A9D4KDA0_DREPO|nr:hypothetical protein DPMN_110907 [Dreissena polymorpha]